MITNLKMLAWKTISMNTDSTIKHEFSMNTDSTINRM